MNFIKALDMAKLGLLEETSPLWNVTDDRGINVLDHTKGLATFFRMYGYTSKSYRENLAAHVMPK